MRIAVVNTKGGVGKTTLAVHLATMLCTQATPGAPDELGERGPRVPGGPTLLIDGDPQASAASWAAWRRSGIDGQSTDGESPTTVCLSGRAVFNEGARLAESFVHTVIDAGGRDSASLRAALLLAERAVVPLGASTLDAAALTDLLEIAAVAREINPDLVLRVLLARVDPRTRDAGEMLDYLAEQRLEVVQARVCERVAYRRAIGDGLTVGELVGARRDPAAVEEIGAVFREVTR
jgi:chromosome partitioning protein